MSWKDFLRRKKRNDARAGDEAARGHRGYYSLEEPYSHSWGTRQSGHESSYDADWDRWDAAIDGGAAPPFDQSSPGQSPPGQRLPDQRPASRIRRIWRSRSPWWWVKRALQLGVLTLVLLIAWLAITAPLSKSLEPIAAPQITLLAADGTPIARNGAIMAEPVDIDKLPDHVVESFLAIEDRRFYSHWGVDPRGVARAAWTGVGGGSTITQQLAKFTFLTPERSMTRKAREALIAVWLEAWLTKDEILERYLSNAYFGDNVYGLRAASLHFFYRKPENLKPEQAAMLAGLVQAPSRFNPARHFERAEKRRKMVVNAMVAAEFLTQAEADAMPRPVLDLRATNDLPTGTYFADWALPEARKQSATGYASLTYTTTLDSRLQNIARRVIQRAPLGEAQVALVAMRPDGEVVAMVGGRDYRASPFNRATQAKRQPGSTFKLFVYLAALEGGMQPDDVIDNSAFESGSYRPKNYGERYSDSITLEQAFARSSNVAAVRLFGQLGSEAVIGTARDFGIRSPLRENDPSLALGTSELSLMELTAAYAGVAGNNFPVDPHAFAAEEAGWFDWAWDGKSSLSGSNHRAIEKLLRTAVNDGTGRAATLSGPNFGKTGTSQGNRDALFVGYAGDLVVGVWIGNDDNTPLDGITGGGLPARIWRDFMRSAQGAKAAPAKPANERQTDPGGPVEPLDVPELEDIPLGDDGSRLRIREGEGVTLETEIENFPLEITLDEDGLRMEPGRRRERERERERQ